MNTEITLLKCPGEEDWMFAKSCALVTIGKHSGKAPDMNGSTGCSGRSTVRSGR